MTSVWRRAGLSILLTTAIGAAVMGAVPGAAYADVVNRQVVTGSFTVQAGQGWDTVVSCPAGKVATGGGYSGSADPNLMIDYDRPATSGQGWHVHATNWTGVAQTITGYVVCAATSNRQVVTGSFTVQAGQGWDTVVSCPAGKVATGGGYSGSADPNLMIDYDRPATSGQGWHVHATNWTGVAQTVTGYVVCATGN